MLNFESLYDKLLIMDVQQTINEESVKEKELYIKEC